MGAGGRGAVQLPPLCACVVLARSRDRQGITPIKPPRNRAYFTFRSIFGLVESVEGTAPLTGGAALSPQPPRSLTMWV